MGNTTKASDVQEDTLVPLEEEGEEEETPCTLDPATLVGFGGRGLGVCEFHKLNFCLGWMFIFWPLEGNPLQKTRGGKTYVFF